MSDDKNKDITTKEVTSGSFFSEINPSAGEKKNTFVPGGTGGVPLVDDNASEKKISDQSKALVLSRKNDDMVADTVLDESKTRLNDKFADDLVQSLNDSHISYGKTVNTEISSSKPRVDVEGQKKDRFLLYKRLPFIGRKIDFGTWVEHNKVAVSITVGVYLVALFAFASVRININSESVMQGVLIEIEEPESVEEPEKPQEEPEKKKEMKPVSYEDVRNTASDARAQLDGGLKDDKGTKANDIYKDAEQLNAKLAASRAAYEQAQSELSALNERPRTNNQRKGSQEKERKASRVSGNVTVEYDLLNRTAVYLPVPSYKCHNGGRVVVNIVVNRNGDVVSASVDKSISSDDACLCDNAIAAAKESSFNVSETAPARQSGTITYLFLSQ